MRIKGNPSASGSIFGHMAIRDFQDGQMVEQALLLRELDLRQKRGGEPYLKLVLSDRTSTLQAIMWDGTPELARELRVGEAAFVAGRFSVHQKYGPQLTVAALRCAEAHEYDAGELTDGPPRDAAQMEADLRELLDTVQNPHLQRLLDRLLGPRSEVWPLYRDAPAAKYYHQAYRHGLLEHCLTVAQSVSAIAATFPGLDRDIAVTGALLHDIGKLEAYAFQGAAIELTDAGKLQGEIPLGYHRVRSEIEQLEGFPEQLAEAVLHIILSHHGQLEHGSPVVPATREATLVHMIDNLGGRLGSFDRLEKELPDGQQWSAFDRAIGGGAYFGPRESAGRQAA
jgi:3'-5' exoribonuclease